MNTKQCESKAKSAIQHLREENELLLELVKIKTSHLHADKQRVKEIEYQLQSETKKGKR